MAVEIQYPKSKWFYGRMVVDGRRLCVNLAVEIQGTPPSSLREHGDTAFELSRARAQVAYERWTTDLKRRGHTEELHQKILEVRTGGRIQSVLLVDLPSRWRSLPRRRKIRERYETQCIAHIGRFTAFVNTCYPKVKDMAGVTDTVAREFMNKEEERGLTPKSYNNILTLLGSCFTRLRKAAGLAGNPFGEIPMKEQDTIHRVPFSADELSEIIGAARADEFIYPLIVVGVTTAMRLGDCAQLSWRQVNLRTGFIDVKTSKTRKLVTIPIFPLLRELLVAQPRDMSGYVFPTIAKQYQVAPDVLTNRVHRVMKAVGFGDLDETSAGNAHTRGAFREVREVGLRRASLRGFHSFRVSWVTLALNAGVPMDLVRKITGHQSVDLVLTNYHQPGREDYRRELSAKLPLALTGRIPEPSLTLLDIREKLAAMTDSTWQTVRDELLAAMAKAVDRASE